MKLFDKRAKDLFDREQYAYIEIYKGGRQERDDSLLLNHGGWPSLLNLGALTTVIMKVSLAISIKVPQFE